MTIQFFVPGKPAPAGSKTAFVNPKTNRPIVTDASKRSRPWKNAVAAEAMIAMEGREMFGRDVPVGVEFNFCFDRPKGHMGTGRNADKLKPSAPQEHTKTPDALKLARAVEDALTGIVYHDDSVIVEERITKQYGTPQGVFVRAWAVPRKAEVPP
jgi:Holliday junction resolvase RusA-like endonuclease